MAPLRDTWSTAILHLSAFINRKKNDLLITHGRSGLMTVLSIIGGELLLLIISLPSYLAARPVALKSASKEYRLRRSLSLGAIVTLLVIWIIKLLLILFLVWHTQSYGSLTIRETAGGTINTETAAHDMLVAAADPMLPPPIVTTVKNTHGFITLAGTAPALNGVIVAFSATDPSKAAEPKIYTAWADANGHFTLVEDTSIFNLPPGSYTVSAITYDRVHMTKSANSQTFHLTVTRSFTEWFTHGLDRILNVIALLVIIVGILITILVS